MKKTKTKIISLTLIFSMLIIGISESAALNNTFVAEKTGHKFTEESFAIIYDVLSNKLVEDLTPGEFEEELNNQNVDPAPYADANFYCAYINLGQVQTMYMAIANYTLDNRNNTQFGVSPYQIMQQHFRTPSGKHVLVQNSFAGLVAYQETGELNGVPNKDDNLYYGNSLRSQFHKFLLNRKLSNSLGFDPLNIDEVPIATPKILTKTTNGDEVEYTFGMDYENLFVVWHSMHVDENIEGTILAENLLSKIVAFSSIDYLNFTYKISGTLDEDNPVNITTTTEYDIGPISDLWIINDQESKTQEMGGSFYDLVDSTKNISRYNTPSSVGDRLNGDNEVQGFGLAVANYARIKVISVSESDENTIKINNENGKEIDSENSDINVSSLDIKENGITAFNIDFASKPNYTLDGGEPMPAPVKLYPQIRLKGESINDIDGLSHRFINSINMGLIQARVSSINEKFDLEDKNFEVDVNKRNVFYTICFPQWEGKSINQDPTFTAYAEPLSLSSFISGPELISIGIIGLVSVSFLLVKKKNH